MQITDSSETETEQFTHDVRTASEQIYEFVLREQESTLKRMMPPLIVIPTGADLGAITRACTKRLGDLLKIFTFDHEVNTLIPGHRTNNFHPKAVDFYFIPGDTPSGDIPSFMTLVRENLDHSYGIPFILMTEELLDALDIETPDKLIVSVPPVLKE